MLTPNDPEDEFNLKLVVSKEAGIKIEGMAYLFAPNLVKFSS